MSLDSQRIKTKCVWRVVSTVEKQEQGEWSEIGLGEWCMDQWFWGDYEGKEKPLEGLQRS